MEELIRALKELLPAQDISEYESMARHTTFRTGGAARVFVCVRSEESLREVLSCITAHDVPFFILGNGSNLLVSDKGYEGVVVKLSLSGDRGTVLLSPDNGSGTLSSKDSSRSLSLSKGAGTLNTEIAAFARDASLTGFEFAAGIPGTIGGAVVMNAGAYGGEMKDIVERVNGLLIDRNHPEPVTPVTYTTEEMQFGYRTSLFRAAQNIVITSVTLRLTPGDKETIAARMQELAAKRREKQPLDYPSAGSTFKRPEGYFAGALIEEAGCKGLQIGGAQVSEKHCGFLINKDSATASDIYQLICTVQDRVLQKNGVHLEPEVILLGNF